MSAKFDVDDVRLSMYALGELEGEERAEIEALLAGNPEARAFVDDLRRAAGALESGLRGESAAELSREQRESVERAAKRGPRRLAPTPWVRIAIAAGLSAAVISGGWWWVWSRTTATEDEANARKTMIGVPASREVPSLEAFEGLGYAGGGSPTVQAELAKRDWGDGSLGARFGFESGAEVPEVVYLGKTGYTLGLRVEDLNGFTAGNEAYQKLVESAFQLATDDPLSTFSIDVDTASYANVRRFLMDGQLPPADAVRIEELVNYFDYDYPQSRDAVPFTVNTAVAPCPWNPEHKLLRIGLKGREVLRNERNASNLVFLVDVSGSMDDPRKLPLVVSSLRMLAGELDGRDRIAIVVYAGSSGLVLDSTSARERATVLEALDRLRAGGSTNGGEGIQLAYKLAREHFVAGGTNRVILCTDGDFNVGVTSQQALIELIESERKSGVFLSVLGFGTGNLKDSTMEQLADKGNGNYAYVDSLREARKVLVEQIGGTLETIAKDVKIQIEFNPAQVSAWRLVGYENRVLAHQDFHDDAKDAGEIGAGHAVTALYELVPAGADAPVPAVDPLRYQAPREGEVPPFRSRFEPSDRSEFAGELAFVKLRYKDADGDESRLLSQPIVSTDESLERADADLRFAAAVAAFGMKLRGSPHVERLTFADIGRLASSSIGRDVRGYRVEFLDLVRRAQELR